MGEGRTPRRPSKGTHEYALPMRLKIGVGLASSRPLAQYCLPLVRCEQQAYDASKSYYHLNDRDSQKPVKVSIVIRNWNYGRFLSDAIDSALAQTHAATEVVVVDDGSTDDSREILALYGNQVRAVLKEQNGGEGSAVNAGFAAATGDIVLFLDCRRRARA